MSLKRTVILSILSVISLVAHASVPDDITLQADTIWFDDGSWYYGSVTDSLFNGYGKMMYADSTVYEGEWKDGFWNGQGELHYPDGDSYEGEFCNHQFCGYGTYLYADGASYKGHWERGMFNGSGTMEYADGSIYAGQWKDDRKEGLGVFYDSATGGLLKGDFHDDYFIDPYDIQEDYQDDYDYDPVIDPILYAQIPQRPDSCWHYRGDWNVYLTYGVGRMMTIHADYYPSNRLFAGFAFGFNTITYGQGLESMVYDEETGGVVNKVQWDDFKDEIMTEHTYSVVKLAAQIGLGLGRFNLGVAMGGGIQKSVRNCRCLHESNSFFEVGSLYYRTKITGLRFTYDVFADYTLKKDEFKYTNFFGEPEPIPYRINLRAGYSNVEELYIGLGISF